MSGGKKNGGSNGKRTMGNCEDCPDYEELYMSKMNKPKSPEKKVEAPKSASKTAQTTKAVVKKTADNSRFNAQTTDSNQ